MTSTEVETAWGPDEIVEFMTPPDRHVMHLKVDTGEYQTGEGLQFSPSFTLRCTAEGCRAVISGLVDARQVFTVIQEHCTPL